MPENNPIGDLSAPDSLIPDLNNPPDSFGFPDLTDPLSGDAASPVSPVEVDDAIAANRGASAGAKKDSSAAIAANTQAANKPYRAALQRAGSMRLAATHHSNPSAGIGSMASGDSPSW